MKHKTVHSENESRLKAVGYARVSTEAQQRATFSFRLPQNLPPETTLESITLSNDNHIVRVFYNNPKLADAQASSDTLPFQAKIIIEMGASEDIHISKLVSGQVAPIIIEAHDKNGISVVQTIPQQPVGDLVKVCGVDGFGRGSDGSEPGVLIFWKAGVEYTITAKLPLVTLETIANSMC